MLHTKIVNVVKEISESVNLEETEIVVFGGRGMGNKENWVPRSHQVGQFGKIVSPKLYIACGIAILVVAGLGIVIGLPEEIFHATLPKSVMNAIALDIGSKFGWQGSLITMMTVTTGIIGAVIAPYVCKFIKSPVAKGLAIGTSSHAVGTSKAIEMGEVEGAMSGLGLSLAAISTSFLVPIFLSIFNV